MTDTAPTTAADPEGAPRLAILDILRGIGVFGILFMNVEAMGGALNAIMLGDPRPLGWGGLDQAAWWAKDVLGEGTARCLLEMLFGAGMVILTGRIAGRAYAWRNVVLLAFGLAHVFVLLWPGEILHTYALAALVAMGFRGLRPRLLLTIGLGLATLQLFGGGTAVVMANMQRHEVADIRAKQAAGGTPTAPERATLADFARKQAERARDRRATQAIVAAEDKARTGGARTWATSLWGSFIAMEKMGLEPLFVWEAASTMLIGAALFKLGILQGLRSRRFYVRLTLIGYGLGLPLRLWGAYVLTRFDHLPSLAYPFGEYARLSMTLGHVGLVTLLAASAAGARWLRPFAAAGRTALTLYVLQTLVTMWVLYPPWGFALYGRQGWASLMLTALAIDAVLLVLAVWWVERFAIAPVEWAWRSIVAGRRLGWRRTASA